MHFDCERRIGARRVVSLVPDEHFFFRDRLPFVEVQGGAATRILPCLSHLFQKLDRKVCAETTMLPINDPQDVPLREKDLKAGCFVVLGFEANSTDAALPRTAWWNVPDVADDRLNREIRLLAQEPQHMIE